MKANANTRRKATVVKISFFCLFVNAFMTLNFWFVYITPKGDGSQFNGLATGNNQKSGAKMPYPPQSE